MPYPQRVWLLFGCLSPSKFGDEISSFADPGCLSWILGPGSEIFPSWIPDPESKFFPSPIPNPQSQFFPSLDPGSRIHIKKFKYFNPKKWFLSSQKYDPGFPSRIRIPRIRILTFYPSQIPISDPRSRSWIPDPESSDKKGTGSLIPDTRSRFATLVISD